MRRVVVIGQPGQRGPLSVAEFAQLLARRLGAAQLQCTTSAGTRFLESSDAESEIWVTGEAAGVFNEQIFRRADTIVWLNFSPLAFLRDWISRWRALHARAEAQPPPGSRAALYDIVVALARFAFAPQVYRLMRHPALAHASLHELRTPEQARFWLKALEHRLRGPRAAERPVALRTAPAARSN